MVAIIISFVVGVVVACVYHYFFSVSNTNNPKEIDESEKPNMQVLLNKLGAQILEQKEKEYVIRYQGGTYVLKYDSETDMLSIDYPNCHPLNYEDMRLASIVANYINIASKYWKLSICLDDEKAKETPLNVSLSYSLRLVNDVDRDLGILGDVLQGAFYTSRAFITEFEKGNKNKKDFNVQDTDNDFNHNISFVRNRLVAGKGDVTQEKVIPDGVFSLQGMMNLYENVVWGCAKQLRVVSGEKRFVTQEVRQIMTFDMYLFIKERCSVNFDEAQILITFEHNDLQIHVTKVDGCTDKSLFYKITLNVISHDSDRLSCTDRLMTSLVEIRLTDTKQDYWEAKYMIDEALALNKAGKFNLMTDEQRMLVSIIEPSVQYDMYWAKKYYNAKCYFQALALFRKILSAYSENFDNLDDNAKEVYFEICFDIGFIYMELGMHESAFYYLNRAKISGNIPHIMEYVNCVCNMNDAFAINCVNDYAERTEALLKENEDNENYWNFHTFLRRRYVYLIIEKGRYGEAEGILNDMIEHETDIEFAKKELEYIKEKREENERKTE